MSNSSGRRHGGTGERAERILWPASSDYGTPISLDRRLLGRINAYMFLFGPAMLFATLLVPHSAGTHPLEDPEWAEVRRHTELGARILVTAELDGVAELVSRTTSAPTATATRRGSRATRSRSARGSSPSPTRTRR